MSDVQFEEDKNGLGGFTSRKILGAAITPSMARGLMKFRIVKTPKQAQYLMIGIIIICLALISYIYFRNNAPRGKEAQLYQEDFSENIRAHANEQQKQFINSLPHKN